MKTNHIPFEMPKRGWALNQNWVNLTFLHWEVDHVLLKKYIPEVNYTIKDRDLSRPKRGTLSNAKILDLINYKQLFTFEDGIKEYVNYKLNEKKH